MSPEVARFDVHLRSRGNSGLLVDMAEATIFGSQSIVRACPALEIKIPLLGYEMPEPSPTRARSWAL